MIGDQRVRESRLKQETPVADSSERVISVAQLYKALALAGFECQWDGKCRFFDNEKLASTLAAQHKRCDFKCFGMQLAGGTFA